MDKKNNLKIKIKNATQVIAKQSKSQIEQRMVEYQLIMKVIMWFV